MNYPSMNNTSNVLSSAVRVVSLERLQVQGQLKAPNTQGPEFRNRMDHFKRSFLKSFNEAKQQKLDGVRHARVMRMEKYLARSAEKFESDCRFQFPQKSRTFKKCTFNCKYVTAMPIPEQILDDVLDLEEERQAKRRASVVVETVQPFNCYCFSC